MVRALVRRWLAAGALALYALVAGVLLPLHAAGEGAAPPGGTPAASVAADCHDRDCHEPGHRHGGHAHDPATCLSCAQGKVLATGSPAAATAAPRPLLAGTVESSAATDPVAARGAANPARAPPALS
jgi:hypothetical protein